MTTYHCDGFRPVSTGFEDRDGRTVEDFQSAARVFAARQARREYGPNAYCRTIRLDTTSMDGTYANYEAFIGAAAHHDRSSTAGHNVRLCVRIEGCRD